MQVFPDSIQILCPKICWQNYGHNALRLLQDFIPKKSTGSRELYAEPLRPWNKIQNTNKRIHSLPGHPSSQIIENSDHWMGL
jgi:hypothetical protein